MADYKPPDYKPQIPYGSDHYEGGVYQITSPLLKGQVVDMILVLQK